MHEHGKDSRNSEEACDCGQVHDHTTECDPGHSRRDLSGAAEEIPAVFSRSFQLKSQQAITGEKLKDHLVAFIECLKQWAADKKYYIGHIKIFAQGEKGFTLWLSTTGKDINVKAAGRALSDHDEPYTVHVTAIIFGADEPSLRKKCLELLKANL